MASGWKSSLPVQGVLLLALACGCAPSGLSTSGLVPETGVSGARGQSPPRVIDANSVVAKNLGRIRGALRVPVSGAITRYAEQIKDAPSLGLLELRNTRYQLKQTTLPPGTAPLAGARVTAFNAEGQAISNPVFTDEQGGFLIESINPSGPLIFVRASVQRENFNFFVTAAAPAPRESGIVDVVLSPASTLVGKKAVVAFRTRAVNPVLLKPSFLARITALFTLVLSDRGLVAACILDDVSAATLFDEVVKSLPSNLLEDLRREAELNDNQSFLDPTAPTPGPARPSSTPNASASPTTPGGSPTPPAPTPSASGTPIPSASASGSLNPGSAQPGGPRGTLKTIAQVELPEARVEIKPGGADVFVPAGFTMLGVQLGALDREVLLTNLEQSIRATCFDDGLRYEFDGREIYWEGGAVPVFDIGQLAFVDMAVKGRYAYLTSVEENNIYRVDLRDGLAEIFAGAPLVLGGFKDGNGTAAEFSKPMGIVAGADALYVADAGNHRVRRVGYDGVVTTLAGGRPGTSDGTGVEASFQSPTDLTLDPQGVIYTADRDGHRIRRITPQGVVTTISGTARGNTDGTGASATLEFPHSIGHGELGGNELLVILQRNGALRLLSGW